MKTPRWPQDDFLAVYQQTVRDVLDRWTPENQAEIARHNRGWDSSVYDFPGYLWASATRYSRAYAALRKRHPGLRTVTDVGGFFGVWAVTLRRLGVEVTMTEALKYYGPAFDPLFEFVSNEGVRIADMDPFDPLKSSIPAADATTLLAVLEHYPHSLRVLISNAVVMTRSGGTVLIEVPNLAYWPTRVRVLRGGSPHPAFEVVWASEIPFTGHHREFTMADLRALEECSPLRLLAIETFNYSWDRPPLGYRLRRPIERLLPELMYRWRPATREVLLATFETST